MAHNYVPYTPERIAPVVEAVAALDADFVCLQEVWEPADVEAIQQGTAEAFPHQLYVDTTDLTSGDPACTPEETDPLLACVLEFCDGNPDLAGCVMENCVAEFTSVSKPCSTCLVANIAKPIEEIITSCLEGSAALVYEGRNGVLLLSRQPLAETDHLVLDSFIIRRVLLHAKVEAETGPIHLFCTHLSTSISEIDYAGEFDDWKSEQAHQIDQAAEHIATAAGEDPAILLGDMNCGPAIPPDINAEWEENYQLFVDAGFEAPFVAQESPPCTWCSDNVLTGGTKSRIIDHVLVKGLGEWQEELVAARILDQPITVTDPLTTEEVEIFLSDHYGVQVRLP